MTGSTNRRTGNTELILQQLKSIPGRKIVTWVTTTSQGDMTEGTFDMNERYIETTNIATLRRLWQRCPVVFYVRKFTDQRDATTGLPIKELYGFCLTEDRRIIKLTPEELAEHHETCFETGARLPREPAVEYR